MPKAIVIGGGFGGIASALRMRAKGYNVTLIDRCPSLGGRAQVFYKDGFKHDAGPTIITAPYLLEELYDLFGYKLKDHIKLVSPEPWYQFIYSDGSIFNYSSSIDKTLENIKNISPEDCEGYKKLLVQSKKIYDIGYLKLAEQSFHSFLFMLKQTPYLIKLKSYDSVYKMVSRYIKNEKLRKAFSIQPLLVGGNPYSTTSIYGLIHYLERAHGVHFVMGGTGELVNALKKLMKKVGIEICLNTTIEKLVVSNKKITHAIDDTNKRHTADIFISNIDPIHLYKKILGFKHASYFTKLKSNYSRHSMGLFVLFFGTSKKYNHIAHHTIIFGNRFKELLNDIFKKKIISNDFSIYLHRPTATDKSFAPPNKDSFYALIPVPNLSAKINWEEEGAVFKNKVVKFLDKTVIPNLINTIESDFYMTPKDFEQDYLSTYGSGFSIAPYFTQSAWFRFHNKSESIKNLYLVGAGSHPGAGLPGVLSSAKVIDKMIINK